MDISHIKLDVGNPSDLDSDMVRHTQMAIFLLGYAIGQGEGMDQIIINVSIFEDKTIHFVLSKPIEDDIKSRVAKAWGDIWCGDNEVGAVLFFISMGTGEQL